MLVSSARGAPEEGALTASLRLIDAASRSIIARGHPLEMRRTPDVRVRDFLGRGAEEAA